MPAFVTEIWERATTPQPLPSTSTVVLIAAVALALVVIPATWQRVRLGITMVHEGGHAAVGVLVGRRLQGIRLHSDTSGLTVSRGRPSGPGMLATLLAGYLAPALVGLCAALLLTSGYAVGLLWLVVLLMAAMLVWIRNVYGAMALAAWIAVTGAMSWYASPQVQSAAGYLLGWVLLLAAPRPVIELLLAGRRRNPKSDPDQLARLTRVPAVLWILLMLAANLVALAIGASTLAPELSAHAAGA